MHLYLHGNRFQQNKVVIPNNNNSNNSSNSNNNNNNNNKNLNCLNRNDLLLFVGTNCLA